MFLSIQEKIKELFLYFVILIIFIFSSFYFYNFLFREKIIFYNLDDNNFLVKKQNYFILKGEAKHIKEIKINKKNYYLDQNNNFNIKLHLLKGQNYFNLVAKTESGKVIKRKFLIFYKD